MAKQRRLISSHMVASLSSPCRLSLSICLLLACVASLTCSARETRPGYSVVELGLDSPDNDDLGVWLRKPTSSGSSSDYHYNYNPSLYSRSQYQLVPESRPIDLQAQINKLFGASAATLPRAPYLAEGGAPASYRGESGGQYGGYSFSPRTLAPSERQFKVNALDYREPSAFLPDEPLAYNSVAGDENERALNVLKTDDLKTFLAELQSFNEAQDQQDVTNQVKFSETKRRQDDGTTDDKQKLGEEQPERKFTTLLEDEESDNKLKVEDKPTTTTTIAPESLKAPIVATTTLAPENPSTKSEAQGSKDNRQAPNTVSRPDEIAPATTPSYGTVVTGTSATTGENQTSIKDNTSVFHKLYKKITKYLPFLSQIAIIKDPKQAANNSSSTKTSDKQTASNQIAIGASEKRNSESSDSGADLRTKANANPRVVSIHLSKSPAASDLTVDSREEEDLMERLSEIEDKTTKQQRFNDDEFQLSGSSPSLASASFGSTNFNSNNNNIHNDALRPAQVVRVEDVNEVMPIESEESELTDNNDNIDNNGNRGNINENKHRVSLLRQSSDLVLPFKANDELVVHNTGNREHPDSLLGRYIYAPTHHYYLNSGFKGLTGASEERAQQQLRHLHPGEQVYGSYETLKPLYGKGEQSPYMLLDKTNDMYFLVMVGAFCMMAVAVVLAAGLFAYRVQQNRKINADTDYPTYGVVGPSNLNGKCGAAAFVGGYFGGAPGGASSAYGSKSGSTKNIPDSTSGDSGVGANSDKSSCKRNELASLEQQVSGGNRSNYMNNQNAARMYHYQHQKQQMIISDRASTGRHTSASDLDSDDENEEGSYTVYECPGLASAHEMEIKNPLFNDDRTP